MEKKSEFQINLLKEYNDYWGLDNMGINEINEFLEVYLEKIKNLEDKNYLIKFIELYNNYWAYDEISISNIEEFLNHNQFKYENTFIESLNKAIKKQLLLNIKEIQKQIETKKISKELNIKIEKYEKKTGFKYDDILDNISKNQIAASFLAKDPLKQNLAEQIQIDYYNKKYNRKIIKLSQTGLNAIRIKDGKFINDNDENSTKSIDGFDKDDNVYYYCKYTNEKGGAQDNQFKDLVHFINECNKYCDKNDEDIKFVVLISGHYYTDKRINQLKKNVKFTNNILIEYLN